MSSRGRQILCAWLLAVGSGVAVQCLPGAAVAADACAGGGLSAPVIGAGIGGTGAPQSSGMGGTGTTAHGSGIGGTGDTARSGGGLGGTGNVAGSGSGIGGTGNVAAGGSGIGGTGSVAARGSGIGGTGDVAGIGGTGIVGTITGFGSICVNGVEIHYDTKTPTWMGGQPAAATGLAIGQVVSVNAQGVGQQVRARAIRVLYAVAGPVTRVDPAGGRLQVLGQQVQLPRGARQAVAVRPGDFIQVSGLRRPNGVIVASRIHPAARGGASVTGPVTAVAPGRIQVYGLTVDLGGTPPPAGLRPGRIVHVSGQLEAGGLRADRVELQQELPFGGRVQHLSIEGYIHRSGNRLVNVDGTDVEISRQTRFASGSSDELKQDVRVRISGRIGADQRLHAERIEFESQRPDPAHAADARGHHHGEHEVEHTGREATDRPEAPEPPEHDAERPEQVERPESPERPESVERPETPERPEIDS